MAINTLPCFISETYFDEWGQGWIKFTDGTMITTQMCTVSSYSSGGSPYAYRGTKTDNFLVTFADDNVFAFANQEGNPEDVNATVYNVNRSGFTIQVGSTGTGTRYPRVIAIGRYRL